LAHFAITCFPRHLFWWGDSLTKKGECRVRGSKMRCVVVDDVVVAMSTGQQQRFLVVLLMLVLAITIPTTSTRHVVVAFSLKEQQLLPKHWNQQQHDGHHHHHYRLGYYALLRCVRSFMCRYLALSLSVWLTEYGASSSLIVSSLLECITNNQPDMYQGLRHLLLWRSVYMKTRVQSHLDSRIKVSCTLSLMTYSLNVIHE
jgi:hypothetical protein